MAVGQGGDGAGVGDDPNVEAGAMNAADGEADAIEGDATLGHDVAGQGRGDFDFEDEVGAIGFPAGDAGGGIDVTGDEVTAEAGIGAEGALEVDAGAGLEGGEVGGAAGFLQEVEGEVGALDGGDGEAAAVGGDAVAKGGAGGGEGGLDGEAAAAGVGLEGGDATGFFNDSGEHGVEGGQGKER